MNSFSLRYRGGVALGVGARPLAITLLGCLACDGENLGPARHTPRLAFQSGRDGNYEIYVMKPDGRSLV